MDAARDLAGWPMADASRFVRARPYDWHVQSLGEGPDLLFLHGAGGATHSWRDVLPLLATDHRCIAVDLPGHGFTRLGSRFRSSLPAMSADLLTLIRQEGWAPRAIVGHSAGSAVALRAAFGIEPRPRIVGINPALEPFRGLAGLIFPTAARMLALTPFALDAIRLTLVAPERAERLIAGTGSEIGSEGVRLYARLLRDRAHVEGALMMMAQWSLGGLLADLPRLDTPVLFLTGTRDSTVPPRVAEEAARRLPDARVEQLTGLGHLAHEEAPDLVAARIRTFIA